MNRIIMGFSLSFLSLMSIAQTSIYDFKIKSVSGGNINMSDFKGKKILIINIASGSESKLQYGELKELASQPNSSDMVVICFPSDDFNSEKKNDAELKNYYKDSGGNFYVAKKSIVRGSHMIPLYEWLTMKSKNGVMDVQVKRDFQKFLISKQGKLIGVFSEYLTPMGNQIKEAVKK